MSRVLVTHSYFYRLDPKQWKDARPYPPMGSLLAASVLRESGHEVRFFDAGLAQGPEEMADALSSYRPEVLVIYDDGFNYLTKMCLTVMRDACFRMIALGKASGCKVLVSSSDSTDHPAEHLTAGADIIALGEAEATVVEVLHAWENDRPLSTIAGIAYMHEGQLHRTASRPVMRDLDALPLPAWDLIDMEPYKAIWKRSRGYFSLNLATTRGCPFKCNWCAKPIYGNRYNSRSPEHVVNEIALLNERYAPDHFWFADDIFGLKPGWVQRFDAILKERGLRIRFKIQSRVDLLLENDTIDALVSAGLEEVWVGAESGSQRILDAMDKGTTVEQISLATRLLRAKGVRVCFFLQFGYRSETAADVEATIRMVEELMPDDIGVSISYPLPGTKFHEQVRSEMDGKANWSDSDDLAMMFRQSHEPAYYKRLHRYVHKRYRLRQAIHAWKGRSGTAKRALSLFYYAPSLLIERTRLIRLARA